MVQIITWPQSVLRLLETDFFLRNMSRSAGVSLSGARQIIVGPGAQWEVTLSLGYDATPSQIRLFETLVMRMEGQRNIAALPLFDKYAYAGARASEQEAFSDGTWFADGTGWAGAGGMAGALLTEGTAAVGTNTLTIDFTDPPRAPLEAGDYFSIEGFLYRAIQTVGDQVEFGPSLRTEVTAGTQLQTDPPVFYGRFASDDVGHRPRNLLSHAGPTVLTFVEAFDRPTGSNPVPGPGPGVIDQSGVITW